MAIAVVLVLLVIGSLIFHFASPWWFTPIASNWATMDDTVILTFWVTGVVFVVVNLFLAWVVWKYRHRKDHKADYDPENKKLEWWLTAVTSVGVAAMLAPGLFVWGKFVDVPDDAAVVEALGQQWHWSYRFPGADGELGHSDATLITPANPFGLDPEDPAGRDDVLVASPELRLPVDRPVKVLLRSKDVLHNFTVTQFLGGTGLLIVVSVGLDLIQRIDANLLMRNYAGFLGGAEGGKGPRIRGPRSV